MAADNKDTPASDQLPDSYGQFQGYVQNPPVIKTSASGAEFASFRTRISNNYKGKDGNWVDQKPTYIDVVTFNAAQIGDIRKHQASGEMDKNKPIRVEGYLERDTYEKDGAEQESYRLVARAGETAIKTGKPERGKGMMNDVHIRGAVGSVDVIEGEKNGRAYKFVEMSVARNVYPDWKAKKEGTHTGEDRSSFQWTKTVIQSAKQIAKAEALIESGELAKGSIVSLKGSLVPADYTDKQGRQRRASRVNVKPFDDSMTIVRPANQDSKEKAAPEKAAKPKGRDYDDEIPF